MTAELMNSKFVRRSSVCGTSSVRLWHRLSLNLFSWISFKFYISWLPRAIFLDVCWILKKKNTFSIFFFWGGGIFFAFVNKGPYGNKTLKTLLLRQIAFKSCQTFPDISSQCCFGCLKFWDFDFSQIFEIRHIILWENPKLQLSVKQAAVERNGVKLRPLGWVLNVRRVLLALKWLRSFGAFSTCDKSVSRKRLAVEQKKKSEWNLGLGECI